MKRQVIIKAALAAATLATPTHAQTSSQPQTPPSQQNTPNRLPFRQARNMSVIVFYKPDADFPQALGSGVWIGDTGYVATCAHVVATHRNGPFTIGLPYDNLAMRGAVNISISNLATGYEAKVEASDAKTDVAILKVEKRPSQIFVQQEVVILGPQNATTITPYERPTPKGTEMETKIPTPGDQLLIAGFPLGQYTLVLQTGTATGTIPQNEQIPGPPDQSVRIMISAVTNPGNSGGPVLNEQGKLVGLLEGNLTTTVKTDQEGIAICAWQKLGPDGQPEKDPVTNQPVKQKLDACQQNTGISYAVPSQLIVDIAKRNKINLDY